MSVLDDVFINTPDRQFGESFPFGESAGDRDVRRFLNFNGGYFDSIVPFKFYGNIETSFIVR